MELPMEIRKMDAKRLAKIMKALSNENRVALYMEIAKHEESDFEAPECTISDIVKLFGLSPPTISHHLKELTNADLITTEKRGKYLLARINKETLAEVKQVLSGIEGE
jgi:ArsR family transcriptional regulator, arsenate/arsenite/antimonite-responsive transcriptional repressor